jgi:short chain dehydrogenase
MSKSILIIGAGPGISTAVAQKFGQNGYSIGLINRNAETARAIINGLAEKGIIAFSSTADVADTAALQAAITDLKQKLGAVLLTGGGLANHPHPMYGSLSIGKAGIRNLALQLHDPLKADGIYLGTLTITNTVTPNSATHSFDIVVDKFWELFLNRSEAEGQL